MGELEAFIFSILAFKSTFRFLRLEVEVWHEDNSKASISFFFISKARDFLLRQLYHVPHKGNPLGFPAIYSFH
jgi:hypothetical protein